MTLNLEDEQNLKLPFELDTLARDLLNHILEEEACPYEAEVSLTLVDDASIQEMNRDYRDMDKATDVLSFPMVQYAPPADYSILEDEETAFDCFNPETGELMLGDIVISVEHAYAQAEEYGHSIKREIGFLIAHSLLHLLGYDHMTEEEAAVMEARQDRYLNDLGITRDSQKKDGSIRTDIH